MSLNNNNLAAAQSIHTLPGSTTGGEIDLYEALLAFIERPRHEDLIPQSRQTKEISTSDDTEQAFPVSAIAESPYESGSPSPESEAQLAAGGAEHAAPQQVQSTVSIAIESQTEATSTAIPATEDADENSCAELDSIAELVVSESEVSNAVRDNRTPAVTEPRPSGPLSDFSLPAEILYTGALTQGVCLACGAESDTDDLFCLSCGGFDLSTT